MSSAGQNQGLSQQVALKGRVVYRIFNSWFSDHSGWLSHADPHSNSLWLFALADDEESVQDIQQDGLREKGSCAVQDLGKHPRVVRHFIPAIRLSLLHSLSETSARIRRLGDEGFLLYPLPVPPAEQDWTLEEWDNLTSRPFIYARLSLTVHNSILRLSLTDLTPLPFLSPLSVDTPPGSPIQLLPYNVPAYFLTFYKGSPTTLGSIHSQFQQSLAGCGVTGWDDLDLTSPDSYILACLHLNSTKDDPATRRTQTIIYPTSLALLVSASYRLPLDEKEIPTLPSQLEASPVAKSKKPSGIVEEADEIDADSQFWAGYSQFRVPPLSTFLPKSLSETARQVSDYVDFVVKEREKQRTQSLTRSTSSSNVPTTPAPPTPSEFPLKPEPEPTTYPSPSAMFFPPSLQNPLDVFGQTFYPSPESNASPPSHPQQQQQMQFSPAFPPVTTSHDDNSITNGEAVPATFDFNPFAPGSDAPTSGGGGGEDWAMDMNMHGMEMSFDFLQSFTGGAAGSIGPSDTQPMTSSSTSSTGGPFGAPLPSSSTIQDQQTSFQPSSNQPDPALSASTSQAPRRSQVEELDLMALTDDDFSFFDTAGSVPVPSSSVGFPAAVTTETLVPQSLDEAMFGGPSSTAIGMDPMSIDWPTPFAQAAAGVILGGTGSADPVDGTSVLTPGPSSAMMIGVGGMPTPGSTTGLTPFFPSFAPQTPGQTPHNPPSVQAPQTPHTPHHVAPTPEASLLTPSASSALASGGGPFDALSYPAELKRKFKFDSGLLSPPPEPVQDRERKEKEERRVVLGSVSSKRKRRFEVHLRKKRSWMSLYEEKTDPSVGMVRRLVRKRMGGGQERVSLLQSDGMKEKSPEEEAQMMEEWRVTSSLRGQADTGYNSSSDEEDEAFDDNNTPSGCSTPIPSWIPPGPTLLSTRFSYDKLVAALDAPSQSSQPNAHTMPYESAPTPYTAALLHHQHMGIPTPVSPAHLAGNSNQFESDDREAKERRRQKKEAERFARFLAKECMVNWRFFASSQVRGACTSAEETLDRGCGGVTDVDVRILKNALDDMRLDTFLERRRDEDEDEGSFCPSQRTLDPPRLTLSKSLSLINILPSALRFWDKLGLGPKSGRKDATVFLVFIDENGKVRDDKERCERGWEWLASIIGAFQTNQYGTLKVGTHDSCVYRPGVISFPSAEDDALVSFISSLQDRSRTNGSEQPILLFIALPSSSTLPASSTLRQFFSVCRQVSLSASSSVQIIPHLLSQHSILSVPFSPPLLILLPTIYDRILVKVNRRTSTRQLFKHSMLEESKMLQAFHCVLPPRCGLDPEKGLDVKFERREKASLGVTDKGYMAHVGYSLCSSRPLHCDDSAEAPNNGERWLVCCIVDERGEADEVGVWLCPFFEEPEDDAIEGDNEEAWVVRKVWDFLAKFVRDADVEWRIVFAKEGLMSYSEKDAWITHLNSAMVTTPGFLNVQVMLLSALTSETWSLPSTCSQDSEKMAVDTNLGESSQSFYVDTSSQTELVLHGALPSITPPPRIFEELAESVIAPQGQPDRAPLDSLYTTSLSLKQRGSSPATQLQISLLHIHTHPQSTTILPLDSDGIRELTEEITRNFWHLTVLANSREGRRSGIDPEEILPLHLRSVVRIGALLRCILASKESGS